jgi:hypothetical protein
MESACGQKPIRDLRAVPTNNLIRRQCSETGLRNVEIRKKDKSAGRA